MSSERKIRGNDCKNCTLYDICALINPYACGKFTLRELTDFEKNLIRHGLIVGLILGFLSGFFLCFSLWMSGFFS